MNGKTSISETKIINFLNRTKECTSIICLSEKHAVLAAYDYCTLFDLSNYQKIAQLEDSKVVKHSVCINTDPNKKLLLVRDNTHITLYDTKNYAQIWEKNIYTKCYEFIINPINKEILIGTYDNLVAFDYMNNHTIEKAFNIPNDHTIIFSPTEKEYIIYPKKHQKLPLKQYDNQHIFLKEYNLSHNDIWECKYSPDGSLLSINHTNGCAILDLNTSKHTYLIKNYQDIYSINFNPHSFIVAILEGVTSHAKVEMSYWNAKKQQLLTKKTLPMIWWKYPHDNCMDFICDGTKIIVAGDIESLVIEVPFEALYQPDTKEKCAFALWVLKNYKDNSGTNVLPPELAQLLTYNLLQTHKYSFTNY